MEKVRMYTSINNDSHTKAFSKKCLRFCKRSMTTTKRSRVNYERDTIVKFRLRKDGLRIATSDVAAITGFNPYASIPQIILSLIYQGFIGQKLLQQDASVLGLQFVDENSILEELASQAGKQTVNLLREALLSKPDTVQKAKQIKERVLKEAKDSDKLTKKELKFIEDRVRQNVDTTFGTFHEKDALDAYEKKIGWEVRDRNSEIREWKFIKCDDCNIPGRIKPIEAVTRKPFFSNKSLDESMEHNDRAKKRKKSIKNSTIEVINIDDCCDVSKKSDYISIKETNAQQTIDKTKNKTNMNGTSLPSCEKEEMKPFFSILGCIDGIRDELWCDPKPNDSKNENEKEHYDEFSNASDGKWELREIVIECKHRMNKAFHPPPLYDQIQAVIYCCMYNVDQADIVQVVRRNKLKSTDDKKNESKVADQKAYTKRDTTVKERTKINLNNEMKITNQQDSKNCFPSAANKSDLDITISRISLNDPVFQHIQNFYDVILPRLRSIVDFVYETRSDDSKRYRFLFAASGVAINDYDITNKSTNKSASNNDVMDDVEAWKILVEECNWLADCDTLYNREN